MKKALGIILGGVLLLTQATGAFAVTATKTFTLEATIPSASGISIDAYKVVGENDPVKVIGTDLSFGLLTLDTENSVYRPAHHFYVQVVPQGAGEASTQVTYTEGQKPTAATRSLGSAATAAFVKAVGEDETAIGAKRALSGLDQTVATSQVSGGYLKVYLGLATGLQDPAGVTAFTPADAPGDYTGTVTFTATVN